MANEYENDQNQQSQEQKYTDPNADAQYNAPDQQTSGNSYTYGGTSGQNTNYSYGGTSGQSNDYQYSNYQNNVYGNGGYQNPYGTQMPQGGGMDSAPLSMGEWLLVLIAGMIPCVGLVLYLVWAFGKSGNINRRNFCRANLILQVIGYVLMIIFIIIIVAVGINTNPYYYYY